MRENPHVALCFFWPFLHQQIIVEGNVAMISEPESDEAWGQSQRISGLAHWASGQTAKPKMRSELNLRLGDFKRRFSFEKVPRPPGWCGFAIRPERMEFWRTGWERLNARQVYQRNDAGAWTVEQANP
jgi:pyridoxamine 5'-phosphate oxidase